jgi:hypothetical protein
MGKKSVLAHKTLFSPAAKFPMCGRWSRRRRRLSRVERRGVQFKVQVLDGRRDAAFFVPGGNDDGEEAEIVVGR